MDSVYLIFTVIAGVAFIGAIAYLVSVLLQKRQDRKKK